MQPYLLIDLNAEVILVTGPIETLTRWAASVTEAPAGHALFPRQPALFHLQPWSKFKVNWPCSAFLYTPQSIEAWR